ncbi:MAG: hypothetical protein KGZ87_09665 [Bacteroidetes bacterium]|nr:hypothetical protein [Bacteroidota bacterium]
MKKKTNISFLVIGVVIIIASVVLAKFTYTLRDIRINGELRYCPIININYSGKGGNSADVLINGQKKLAGHITDDLKVGDTIAVRYIKGKSQVVQDDVRLSIYYLYFGLESILLIVGIVFIVGGFMGKTR